MYANMCTYLPIYVYTSQSHILYIYNKIPRHWIGPARSHEVRQVCMYVNVCTYLYIYIYIAKLYIIHIPHNPAPLDWPCSCARISAGMYVCKYVYIFTYIYIYIAKSYIIYIYKIPRHWIGPARAHKFRQVCMYVNMCTYLYIYIYIYIAK